MHYMHPGNSFPRSALFLFTTMWKCAISHKITEYVCIIVTTYVN
jgi:hypothetical protein